MTSAGRAATRIPSDGTGQGASTPAAHSTPGTPTPSDVPGVPQTTVGPAGLDTGGPTVHQPDGDPGWAASVTGRFAHYVARNAIRAVHYDRPSAFGVDGVHAFIDEQGLKDGADLPHCPECERLASKPRWP